MSRSGRHRAAVRPSIRPSFRSFSFLSSLPSSLALSTRCRSVGRSVGRTVRSALCPPGGPGRQPPVALSRMLPRALVVAALAGGTAAFVAHDKEIEIDVDGGSRTLHTFAGTVAEALRREGLTIGEHDNVRPDPATDLRDGDVIAVRYGRPVDLTIDGRREQVWTTQHTVDGTLRALGVRPEGAYVSVSRGAVISRSGLDLSVRTERTVTFLADGEEHTVRTTAATVREAMAEAGVELRDADTTTVPLDGFPRDGQVIAVLRIKGTEETREQLVDFPVWRQADPSLHTGTEIVAQWGRPGLRRVVYRVHTLNGVARRPRPLHTEIIRQPLPQIVKVGTAPLPNTVRGVDHLDWDALARCESGGRPRAVDASGTYGGLYQFDVQTWRGVGGDGLPQDASAAEQTYRAKKLYIRRGATPWPICGRKLHG